MSSLERLARIASHLSAQGWSKEDYQSSAYLGKVRWLETEELFGVEYHIFEDAVAVIAPSFALSPSDEAAAFNVRVGGWEFLSRNITLGFVKWE